MSRLATLGAHAGVRVECRAPRLPYPVCTALSAACGSQRHEQEWVRRSVPCDHGVDEARLCVRLLPRVVCAICLRRCNAECSSLISNQFSGIVPAGISVLTRLTALYALAQASVCSSPPARKFICVHGGAIGGNAGWKEGRGALPSWTLRRLHMALIWPSLAWPLRSVDRRCMRLQPSAHELVPRAFPAHSDTHTTEILVCLLPSRSSAHSFLRASDAF